MVYEGEEGDVLNGSLASGNGVSRGFYSLVDKIIGSKLKRHHGAITRSQRGGSLK